MVEGGAGSIAQRVADALGDAVRLNAPVRSITQRDDRGRRRHPVSSRDCAERRRRRSPCAAPRHRVRSRAPRRSPDALPQCGRGFRDEDAGGLRRAVLARRRVQRPNLRAHSAAEVTLDASPASGSPGVIASFTFGPVAERFDALDPAERRRAVLDALTARLGPRAASPAEFVETAWWTGGVDARLLDGASPPRDPVALRTAAARALRTGALGGNRDVDDVARRDRRRRALRDARRRRDPRPRKRAVVVGVPFRIVCC